MNQHNYTPVQNFLIVSISLCLLQSSAMGSDDEYAIISKKNLFRPDRSEWISTKHASKDAEEKTDPDKLELFGTIIIGDERSALIYEDKTPAKGKSTKYSRSKVGRNRMREKAKLYRPGDYLGSYIVAAIDEKRVELDYYGDKEILYLHEGKEPPKGDYTPLEVSKPQPKVPTKQKPGSQKMRKEQELRKQDITKELVSGKVPAELANVMSQDQLRKLLKFNQDLMKELKESGGRIDQYAIKEKIEAFRKRMMESL